MPWSLDLMSLVTVFVVTLVAGAGWTLGTWLMGKILTAISSRPSQP